MKNKLYVGSVDTDAGIPALVWGLTKTKYEASCERIENEHGLSVTDQGCFEFEIKDNKIVSVKNK